MSSTRLRYDFDQAAEMIADLKNLQKTMKITDCVLVENGIFNDVCTGISDSCTNIHFMGPNDNPFEISIYLFPEKLRKFYSKYAERYRYFNKRDAIKALDLIEAPPEVMAKFNKPIEVEKWVKIVSDQGQNSSSYQLETKSTDNLGEFSSFSSSCEGIPFKVSVKISIDEFGDSSKVSFCFSLETDRDIVENRVKNLLTENGFRFFPGNIREGYKGGSNPPKFVVKLSQDDDFPNRIQEVLDKFPKMNHLALWSMSGTILRVVFLDKDVSSYLRFDIELLPKFLMEGPLSEGRVYGNSVVWSTEDPETMRMLVSSLTDEDLIPKGLGIDEIAKKWNESGKKRKYSEKRFSNEINGFQFGVVLTAEKSDTHQNLVIRVSCDWANIMKEALKKLRARFNVLEGSIEIR